MNTKFLGLYDTYRKETVCTGTNLFLWMWCQKHILMTDFEEDEAVAL